MLIRGVGPGLEPFIGGGFLVDPLLKVFRSEGTTSTLVATNDNWSKSLDGSFQVTGAFSLPDNSRDAAMVLTLAPGVYTAQVSGADGGTGQAIVEIYELP
jgi:inosine/xanthosine triphosphate pyrophosphatase family protein